MRNLNVHLSKHYGVRGALCGAGLQLGPIDAQMLTGASPSPGYKFSTPMPPGVAAPDKVETRFGTLKFFDGFPDQASAEKIYDNLDFQRAVQAYLLALPVVSQAANRDAILDLGPANTTVPIWESLVDSRTVELTANDNTPYTWMWIDLHGGPLVVEVPPKVLGLADDMWYRWVADIGITGPDKGEGGKYLFLPPGYKGDVPQGYYVMRPGSFSVWIPWRSFLVDGDPKPGVDLVKKITKIYPLSQRRIRRRSTSSTCPASPSTWSHRPTSGSGRLLNQGRAG